MQMMTVFSLCMTSGLNNSNFSLLIQLLRLLLENLILMLIIHIKDLISKEEDSMLMILMKCCGLIKSK